MYMYIFFKNISIELQIFIFFYCFFLNIKLSKGLINQYMHSYDYLMILNVLMNLNKIN